MVYMQCSKVKYCTIRISSSRCNKTTFDFKHHKGISLTDTYNMIDIVCI